MGKIVFLLLGFTLYLVADNPEDCLACHQKNQIPSALIYKRYLLKYSTDKAIKEAIYAYLKSPQKSHSIMPSVFFVKFPMKQKTAMDDQALKEVINLYAEHFDIKKRLVNSH
jgi:hypothetical protein